MQISFLHFDELQWFDSLSATLGNKRKESSAMNSVRTKLRVLIVTAIVVAFVGCSTTKDYTRENYSFDHLSTSDAIAVIKTARVFKSSGLWLMSSVSENSIDFERQVISYTGTDGILRWRPLDNQNNWEVYSIVYFSEITKIRMTIDDFYGGGGSIYLFGKDGLIVHIVCTNDPNIYNKLLSALLVLCPNAK